MNIVISITMFEVLKALSLIFLGVVIGMFIFWDKTKYLLKAFGGLVIHLSTIWTYRKEYGNLLKWMRYHKDEIEELIKGADDV